MTTESDVQDYLFTGIAEAVNQEIPIQFPLRNFNPPNDGRYIEIVQITNNRRDQFWGKERTFRGIVRLILHWPVKDTGAMAPTIMLGNLAAKMPKATRWGTLLLTDHPNIDSPIVDGGKAMIVMTLFYESKVV